MTLLFRKLVNKTDLFLVVFLFLELSAPCKKQKIRILQLGSELVPQELASCVSCHKLVVAYYAELLAV